MPYNHHLFSFVFYVEPMVILWAKDCPLFKNSVFFLDK